MADPQAPPSSAAAAAPEVDAANDKSLILLQRVSTAWFILSVAVSAFALYSIAAKLTRLRPLMKWTAVAMVVLGTASNAVQLVYQLMPEGDSSFSWLAMDIVDNFLYATSLSLYLVIARWRALVAAPALDPRSWPASLVSRILRSKWIVVVSSLLVSCGLFLSIITYYTGTSLCHSEGFTIMCMRLYLMVTQVTIMAGDLALAIAYLTTWPRYAKITRLDSSRPGFRALLVVFGLLVSFAMQLGLLLDGFVSSEIWEGSRILWLAHTAVLIALTPILLLQVQIASAKAGLRDIGTLSSTGSSIEDIKAATQAANSNDPELGLVGPRPSLTITDPQTSLLMNGSAVTVPDTAGSRPRLPSGSNAPPLMRSVTPTSMTRLPHANAVAIRAVNPSLANTSSSDSGHAHSLPDPPVSPTTTTSSSVRGRRSKSWIAGMLTLGSGAFSTASSAPPMPNGADPAMVAPMSPIPEQQYAGGAESVRSRSIDISSFDDESDDDEHGSGGGSTLMLNQGSTLSRATTPPPTSASAMITVAGRQ
ncbi:hypothetical protein BCR44DRAFT_28817 [Catenaria anguillulae PL171]|uniref:Uncharacterized protein n=1 Tax=Catenaria anguillulae PL171 TaxID=765915 RepID=A0A1Y2HTU1_9FUNG|nr:hypothetical protein BCR44DRAFT_28817 [Catenaria anguillulae PL171]